jgi:hypothetical protein
MEDISLSHNQYFMGTTDEGKPCLYQNDGGCGCCADSEEMTSKSLDEAIEELEEAVRFLKAKRAGVGI